MLSPSNQRLHTGLPTSVPRAQARRPKPEITLIAYYVNSCYIFIPIVYYSLTLTRHGTGREKRLVLWDKPRVRLSCFSIYTTPAVNTRERGVNQKFACESNMEIFSMKSSLHLSFSFFLIAPKLKTFFFTSLPFFSPFISGELFLH